MSERSDASEGDLTPPPPLDSPVAALVDDFVGAQVIKRALSNDTTVDVPKQREKRPKRSSTKAKLPVKESGSLTSLESVYSDGGSALEPEDDQENIETKPKKRAKKTASKDVKPKKERKPTPKKSRLAGKDDPEYDSDGNEIVKKKRKAKVYPKIEYDIPDVERKTTTFRGACRLDYPLMIGRLGYACLNTVLRSNKPESIFCSRTCRISSIEEEGLELPQGLAMMNVKDLLKMIEVSPQLAVADRQWNEQNK
jgi:UV DNA damage endonuclease